MKKFSRMLLCFTIIAVLAFVGVGCVKDNGKTAYSVTINGGTGGGQYYEGINCTATAKIPSGKQFMNWTVAGQEVSAKSTYVFTVVADIEVTAVFADEVPDAAKKVYGVNVQNAMGSGNYLSGTDCTVKLYKQAEKRSFKGWASVNSEGVVSDVLSSANPYTFTVNSALTISPVFNDVMLDMPENDDNQMILISGATIEYDRRQPSGTAFVPGTAYIMYYVYESDDILANPIAKFRLVQREDKTAYLASATTAETWNVSGELGNYHTGDGNAHNFIKSRINETSVYDTSKAYYFAAQAIAITDSGINYVNSDVSLKTKGYVNM